MADTITCVVCGAVNDAANHFCDQCGASLKPALASDVGYVGAPPIVPDPLQSVPPSPAVAPADDLVCAVCGAAVLPGQAFCDNCGANLIENPPIPAGGMPSASAPTMPDLSSVPLPAAPVMPSASAPTAPDLSQFSLPTDPNADTQVEVLPEDTAVPAAPEPITPPAPEPITPPAIARRACRASTTTSCHRIGRWQNPHGVRD